MLLWLLLLLLLLLLVLLLMLVLLPMLLPTTMVTMGGSAEQRFRRHVRHGTNATIQGVRFACGQTKVTEFHGEFWSFNVVSFCFWIFHVSFGILYRSRLLRRLAFTFTTWSGRGAEQNVFRFDVTMWVLETARGNEPITTSDTPTPTPPVLPVVDAHLVAVLDGVQELPEDPMGVSFAVGAATLVHGLVEVTTFGQWKHQVEAVIGFVPALQRKNVGVRVRRQPSVHVHLQAAASATVNATIAMLPVLPVHFAHALHGVLCARAIRLAQVQASKGA